MILFQKPALFHIFIMLTQNVKKIGIAESLWHISQTNDIIDANVCYRIAFAKCR